MAAGRAAVAPPWLAVVAGRLTTVVPWLAVVAGRLTSVAPWLTAVAGRLTSVAPWLAVAAGWLTSVAPWLAVLAGRSIPRGFDRMQCPPGEVTASQVSNAISGTSNNSNGVNTLDTPFADPDAEALRGKVNELIAALRRP